MDDAVAEKLQQGSRGTSALAARPEHHNSPRSAPVGPTSVSERAASMRVQSEPSGSPTDAVRRSVPHCVHPTSKGEVAASSALLSQTSLPGSYAISPGGLPSSANDVSMFDDLMDNDGSCLTRGGLLDSTSKELIEAQLIDPEVEERRLDDERERLRHEAMESLQASAPKAEVVDTSLERRRRKRVIVLLMTITVASVTAAIVAGVLLGIHHRNDSSGASSRSDQMQQALQTQFGLDIPINEPDNPYSAAFLWMLQNDTYPNFPLETSQHQVLFCQRFSLCVLALSTNFNNWTYQGDWMSPTSECSWDFVNCNSNGELSSIQLGGMNLNGTIPTELFFVTTLEHLHLFRNSLTGTIPTEIGHLTQLKTLALHELRLVGSIPSEIGNLQMLETLYLFGNQLNGTIPTEMKGLYNMKGLYLSNNSLSGSLSEDSLPFMVVLETLSLDNNKLVGSIPVEFGDLLELRSFTIQNNSLTGTIPGSFADLIHLNSFKFSGNKINGSIPMAMCNLPELQVMEAGCTTNFSCSCCTDSCAR